MARRRQTHKTDSTKSSRAFQREQMDLANLRFLSKRGVKVDPTSHKQITAKARELRQRDNLVEFYGHKVTRSQAKTLKARGFITERNRVVVDGPRDRNRKKIKGARMRVAKDGTVSWRTKERTDYIVGLTPKEKKDFASSSNPDSYIADVLKRLRAKHPGLRGKRVQRRLQWGAFQATKDYSPNYFTKTYFSKISPEDKRHNRKTPRIDKLTGFHFVVHTPAKKKTKRKGSKRGTKKRAGRRT